MRFVSISSIVGEMNVIEFAVDKTGENAFCDIALGALSKKLKKNSTIVT